MSLRLPAFYPIVDVDLLVRRGIALQEYAQALRDAGVLLLQYRDKHGSPLQVIRNAAIIKEVFHGSECMLILDDRADLAALAGWDGVHVGQQDVSPDGARKVMGAGKIIGFSTHSEEQVQAADASCADYIAVGPVFTTSSKVNPDPVIGLEGVRRLRALTRKPLVAIGGITRANCQAVIQAGADSVAVISELLAPGAHPLQKVAEDFLLHLR